MTRASTMAWPFAVLRTPRRSGVYLQAFGVNEPRDAGRNPDSRPMPGPVQFMIQSNLRDS